VLSVLILVFLLFVKLVFVMHFLRLRIIVMYSAARQSNSSTSYSLQGLPCSDTMEGKIAC